ncbi:unnamed protein product [Lota lota]
MEVTEVFLNPFWGLICLHLNTRSSNNIKNPVHQLTFTHPSCFVHSPLHSSAPFLSAFIAGVCSEQVFSVCSRHGDGGRESLQAALRFLFETYPAGTCDHTYSHCLFLSSRSEDKMTPLTHTHTHTDYQHKQP